MVNSKKPLGHQEAFSPISLYFHLPFCKKKCDYCHFYVLPDRQPLKDQLMEGLYLEWKKITPLLKNRFVCTIYFGGGTPWLMGAKNIASLLKLVKETLPVSETLEVTLEANPENVTKEEMEAFAEAGINRISIGMQSLDSTLLNVLSRQHDGKKAIDAVHIAKDSGIFNISVDLMYDLPSQTLKTWENTLDQVKKLPITHLSLYNLTIEPHTVFYKHREKLKKDLPDAALSLEMYQMAVAIMKEADLYQYEISAFAKKGFYSHHNTGYWLGRPFLGLGPSAFSDWEGARFQNVANLSRYFQALEKGESPVDFYEKLDPLARQRELLTIRIRMLEGVDLTLFQESCGKLEPETLTTIKSLHDRGFLLLEGSHVRLTKKGILFYDSVASELI